ncbi:MAG: metalloregulator ArsR/SmtB family transcription factor [Shinella zoogloeoides]
MMVEQRTATQFEKSDPGTPDQPSFLPDLRRICLALPNKDEAAAFLKLLANDKRLLILDYLLTGDERSVEEIGIDLDIRQPSLSQHLAKLRNAGFVRPRRDGRHILYSIPDDPSIVRSLRGIDQLLRQKHQ